MCTPVFDLERLELNVGAHSVATGEMCVMEAASVVAGGPWSDHPASASDVVGAVLRSLNDSMSDSHRQHLRRLIPLLVGSHADEDVETARSWNLMDWHCRTWTAAFLDALGCSVAARALTTSRVIEDSATLVAAQAALEAGRAECFSQRADAVRISLEETIEEAATAAGVRLDEPAIANAGAAIRAYGRGPEVRQILMRVPLIAGWDPLRSLSWRDALDAAPLKYTVAAEKAQVESVYALFATSAWGAGWELARRSAPGEWDHACEVARSIGRDAAVVLAWRGELARTVAQLQRSLIDLLATLTGAHSNVRD